MRPQLNDCHDTKPDVLTSNEYWCEIEGRVNVLVVCARSARQAAKEAGRYVFDIAEGNLDDQWCMDVTDYEGNVTQWIVWPRVEFNARDVTPAQPSTP